MPRPLPPRLEPGGHGVPPWPDRAAPAGRRARTPSTDAQQPIRVLDPYRANLGSGAVPPNYEFLAAHNLPADEMTRFPFIANWNDRFDYLLILNAEGARDLNQFLPDKLELVDRRGLAALFRIKRLKSNLQASIH